MGCASMLEAAVAGIVLSNVLEFELEMSRRSPEKSVLTGPKYEQSIEREMLWLGLGMKLAAQG